MAENDDVTGSPDRDVTPSAESTTEEQPPTAAPVLKTRWRDRVWTFRAMLAVALATLLIGGIAGGVVGAAIGHHGRHEGFHRFGPGGGPGMGHGWRMHRGPGWRWQQGPQQPPITPYGAPGSTGPNPSTPSPTQPGATG